MRKRILTMMLPAMVGAAVYGQTVSLSGEWDFNMGDKQEYGDKITLPGSMLTNGKGNDVTVRTKWVSSLYDSSYFFNPAMEKYRVEGQMKFPFFLTPSKHYVGTAWYRRTVDVPRGWRGRSVTLHLERPHIETTVYVNGKVAGRDSSLSVPHEFDITPYIDFGGSNEIAIRIYNGIENVCVGQDSHSVTDQTQGCWNGIVGRMELVARPVRHIGNVQVFPNIGDKSIRVQVALTGRGKGKPVDFLLDGRRVKREKLAGDTATVVIPMGDDVKLWDEFEPNLYTLQTVMDGDTVSTTFGMREISISGRQFYMNGRKIWMRGTVGNCCFPLTGYPPTDEESWLRIFRKCKEYGLNMVRFHSYCPPEAAFAAADKVGFYLQPEGPSWPNHGVRLGRGMTIDRYLMEETQRMVREYGNHPSFCMLAAGNEPAGDWVKWTNRFVADWQKTGDRRRVYCGASVGGGWAWDSGSEYHVKGGARGLDWDRRAPQSADDYYDQLLQPRNFKPKSNDDVNDTPILAHEQGQWCAFPDFREIEQYTGAYRAGNFEIFRDLLRDGGMASQAEKFLMASGRLQTLAYKYEIERNLRTRDYAGFQLLGLNDYSGQGTALVGVLNVFWREKGYCTAEDWRRFCAPVVPLARFPKFVYTNDEILDVPVELYNAYRETLRGTKAEYSITMDGKRIAGGVLAGGDIPVGKNNELGAVHFDLAALTAPSKLMLTVTVKGGNGPKAENCWDFWVYPAKVEMPATDGIYITDTLDDKAVEVLKKGGRVLILAAGKVRMGSDVKQTYLPVFWNTSWFKMRPPHTTGATIDTRHPLFKNFPTDNWTNINWWELVNKAQVMNLREFPFGYQPPVQPIDTWHVSRKLGMMIEANVLGGRLLMTTMDISNDLDRRVVARCMRRAIVEYMSGEDFRPTLTLDSRIITDLFEKQAPAVNMFTKDSPDELKPVLK
ncbi:sugar-binding domain-containing protein [Xylanibacter rodentium]|uniref:sugar-binding domain-containing protein n=1 Tax=Xylanibacter rodentium TaxID=2736289 RepID=UPI002589008A|nr:sugar-binding domain-containing protein [Xylanibacter rodentium]